jgi:hypothetical protein
VLIQKTYEKTLFFTRYSKSWELDPVFDFSKALFTAFKKPRFEAVSLIAVARGFSLKTFSVG